MTYKLGREKQAYLCYTWNHMTVFADVIGHTMAKDYLQKVLQKKTLAHAYAFSGPEHIGKTTMAYAFAASVLGISVKELAHAPNVSFVRLPVDEKTGEEKGIIPVDAIRELRARLQLSSLGNGTKVAMIERADHMNVAAQNALLKTLEEPRGDTLILLLSERPSLLLPTVRSRCVQMSLGLVAREDICSALKPQFTEEVAHSLAGLAGGRPGIALRLTEAEVREQHEADLREALQFVRASFPEKLKRIDGIVKAKEKEAMERQLKAWRLVLHDLLLVSSGNPHLAAATLLENDLKEASEEIPVGRWAQALEVLDEAEYAIHHHVNANLALEEVALSLS